LFQQITRKHFEKLVVIYNHLVIISARISSQLIILAPDETLRMAREKEYQKATSTIDVLLKIIKTMMEPLGDRAILVEVSQKLLGDFQNTLDTENQLMGDTREDELKTFSSHITRYGEVLLNVQHLHPSIISENYLTVYVKILEFVSSQLITDPVATKRLLRFYPLLLQAVRLLNNALNPYNSYSSEPGEDMRPLLLENLGPEEVHQLISILQPFIHLEFGPMGYLDAHPGSDDDGSDEYPEEVIEIEEMNDGDDDQQASIDVEDPADHAEIHIKGIQLDQDAQDSCLPSDLHFPTPTCPPLWTVTMPDSPTQLSIKEPLQVEVEELLSLLTLNASTPS